MQTAEEVTGFDPWAWEYQQPDYTHVVHIPSHIARRHWGKLFDPRREVREQGCAFWYGAYMAQESDIEDALFLLNMADFIVWEQASS